MTAYRTSEVRDAYERWGRHPAEPPGPPVDVGGRVLAGIFWLFGAAVLAAAVLAAAVLSSGCGPSFEERCGLAGGRVEKYDCTTSYVTHHFDRYTSWTQPIESCSRRCVGARAEFGK